MAIYGNMVVPSKAGAGALPTDSSERQVYVPGGEVSGRFSDAAAQIAGQGAQQAAQGLGNLGRGIGQLGGMFVDLYDRHRRLDMAKAEEAYARLQIEGTEERTRLSRLKGANAIGADGKTLDVEAQWRDWYAKAKARHSQGLGDAGLRYFNLHADQFNATQASGVHSYFEQQLGQYEDTQIKFAMDAEASTLAANPFDAGATAASTGRIRALVHQQAVRNGWSAEMEAQAYRAAVGRMWGNAIAIQISQGQFGNAQQLLQQYGSMLSADDVAKLNTAYNSGIIQYANALQQAGNWQGLGQLQNSMVQGTGWNQSIAAEAARRRGTPYKFGTMNDCSGYQTQLWSPHIQDPAVRAKLFPNGRGTSEGIVVEAAKLTQGGRMLGNAELAPGRVGPGMVIGIDSGPNRHPYDNRPNGIDHIVSTYVGPDGRLWVTEAEGGKEGKVHDTPYDEWYAKNSGKKLYGATLVPLLQQGGAPAGGQGVPAGWVEFTGSERGNTIPERNHNPGAVMSGGEYVSYASDAEGFLAQAKALRHKRYEGLSIERLIPLYVGHNPDKDYWNAVLSKGFSLKEVPNLKDDRVLARLMVGIATGECGNLGRRYKPEQVYALLTGGAQPQAGTQSQPAQGVPATPTKLSVNAKALYDSAVQGISAGNVTRQQAEEYLQGLVQSAQEKLSSKDKATRNMAKGDLEDAQAALAALRQSQRPAQAPAPVHGAQPAMPQAGAPMLGLYATPPTQAHVQALRARGLEDDAVKVKQLLPDAEYRAKTTGNCEDLDSIAGTLRQLGKVEDADKVQRLSNLYKSNEQTRQAAVTTPLPQLFEQISDLAQKLNPDVAKGLSAEKHQQLKAQYDLLSDIAKSRMEQLKADPAQAADRDPYSGIAPEANAGDKARGRLEYQAKQGVGEVERRMLTKAEAAGLKDKWDKAPAESKADLIDGWKKEFGENAPRLLGEIGLGPHEQDIASAVLENKEANTNIATKAFRIASLTNKEVPGFEQLTEDDIRTTVEGSKVYNVYKKQALTTLDSASIAVVRQMKDFTKKCLKLGLASDEIKQMLDLGRKTYDEDNAAIVIPKGMDEDQFDGGLKWAVGEPLREFLKDCPSLTDNGSKYGIKDAMNRLKQTGIWVVSPFGDGFVLMDPATQSPVANDKGQFFTVTRLQIENHAERRGQGEPD